MKIQPLPFDLVILRLLLGYVSGAFGKEDTNENCPMWASSGECTNNPKYMMVACPKSCEEASPVIANQAGEPSKDSREAESTKLNELNEQLARQEKELKAGKDAMEKVVLLEKQLEETTKSLKTAQDSLQKRTEASDLAKEMPNEEELRAGRDALQRVVLLEKQLNATQGEVTAAQDKLHTQEVELTAAKDALQKVAHLEKQLRRFSLVEKQLNDTQVQLVAANEMLQSQNDSSKMEEWLASNEGKLKAGKDALEKASSLENQLNQTQKELAAAKEQLQQKQTETSELEGRLAGQEVEMKSGRDALEKQLNDTKLELVAAKDMLQSQIDSSKLEEKLASQEVELKAGKDALEKASILENQLTETQKELAAAKEQLMQRKTETSQLEEQFATREAELKAGRDALEQRLNDTRSELVATKDMLQSQTDPSKLEEQLASQELESKGGKDALEKASSLENQLSQTQKELAAAKEQLLQKQSETSKLEEKLASQEVELKAGRDALEKQLNDTKLELVAAKDMLQSQTDSSKLEEKLASQEAELKAGKDALEKASILENQLNETQKELAAAKEQLLQRQSETIEMQEKLASQEVEVKAGREALEKQLNDTRSELAAAEDMLRSRTDSSMLEEQLASQEAELKAGKDALEKVSVLENKLNQTQEDLRIAKEHLLQMQTETSELEGKLASQEAEIKARRDTEEVEHLTAKEDELKVALEKVSQQEEELQALRSAKEQVTMLEVRLAETEKAQTKIHAQDCQCTAEHQRISELEADVAASKTSPLGYASPFLDAVGSGKYINYPGAELAMLAAVGSRTVAKKLYTSASSRLKIPVSLRDDLYAWGQTGLQATENAYVSAKNFANSSGEVSLASIFDQVQKQGFAFHEQILVVNKDEQSNEVSKQLSSWYVAAIPHMQDAFQGARQIVEIAKEPARAAFEEGQRAIIEWTNEVAPLSLAKEVGGFLLNITGDEVQPILKAAVAPASVTLEGTVLHFPWGMLDGMLLTLHATAVFWLAVERLKLFHVLSRAIWRVLALPRIIFAAGFWVVWIILYIPMMLLRIATCWCCCSCLRRRKTSGAEAGRQTLKVPSGDDANLFPAPTPANPVVPPAFKPQVPPAAPVVPSAFKPHVPAPLAHASPASGPPPFMQPPIGGPFMQPPMGKAKMQPPIVVFDDDENTRKTVSSVVDACPPKMSSSRNPVASSPFGNAGNSGDSSNAANTGPGVVDVALHVEKQVLSLLRRKEQEEIVHKAVLKEQQRLIDGGKARLDDVEREVGALKAATHTAKPGSVAELLQRRDDLVRLEERVCALEKERLLWKK